MKRDFYPKLAWSGIRKNKRVYFPYILTGGLMVMMYYILNYLVESPALVNIPGGSVLKTLFPLGCIVIAVFSLLFLFYTNSFLIRQRYREFGLYNILGMDKKNISRLMMWEVIFTALMSIIPGLICGIAFSKAAELVLLNLLDMEISFTLTIGLNSIVNSLLIYTAIYTVLLINSLIKVKRSKPLELMQSSKVGEKDMKLTPLLAVLGVVLLGAAYYLAVSIEEPVTALLVFFIAVIMVIIGTYLLFISGSVSLCRLLQKKKKYYYNPKHFVSVSSMVYRMKRNGAGLASICILLTMVLVTISSTATLYFGEEDSIKNRYPNSINIMVSYDSIDGIEDKNLDVLKNEIKNFAPSNTDMTGMRFALTSGLFTDDGIIINYQNANGIISYDDIGYLYAISLDDYNKMMNTDKTLSENECLIYCDRLTTQWDTFTLEYGNTYKVKERLTQFTEDNEAVIRTTANAYIIVKDIYSFAKPVFDLKNESGQSMIEYEWKCGFDCESTEKELAARDNVYAALKSHVTGNDSVRQFYVQSREAQKSSFFELYGSLFFLGIILSFVFLLAAVLIIYYKQISEGYEDQGRFEIMQKVGMTKKNIRKSINSQMLTVFFLPLITAGMHLAFAFPCISKVLEMFAFNDTLLNISVTFICFAAFGVFYTIVYKITSGSYYSIVSGKKET